MCTTKWSAGMAVGLCTGMLLLTGMARGEETRATNEQPEALGIIGLGAPGDGDLVLELGSAGFALARVVDEGKGPTIELSVALAQTGEVRTHTTIYAGPSLIRVQPNGSVSISMFHEEDAVPDPQALAETVEDDGSGQALSRPGIEPRPRPLVCSANPNCISARTMCPVQEQPPFCSLRACSVSMGDGHCNVYELTCSSVDDCGRSCGLFIRREVICHDCRNRVVCVDYLYSSPMCEVRPCVP